MSWTELLAVSKLRKNCNDTWQYLQNCIDLSDKLHANIDGCLCNTAAKLHMLVLITRWQEHAYLEVIGNVVLAASWSAAEKGILIMTGIGLFVRRRCLSIMSRFIQRITLWRRSVFRGRHYVEYRRRGLKYWRVSSLVVTRKAVLILSGVRGVRMVMTVVVLKAPLATPFMMMRSAPSVTENHVRTMSDCGEQSVHTNNEIGHVNYGRELNRIRVLRLFWWMTTVRC